MTNFTCAKLLKKEGKFWMIMVSLALVFIFSAHVSGSFIRVAKPQFFVSPNNNYYFKLVPNSSIASEGGKGYLYKVSQGNDKLLYETSGWFSFNVLVLTDGVNIVRIGEGMANLPPAEALAVSFYERGRLVAEYHVSELVHDAKCFIRYIGSYRWLDGAVRADHKRSNILEVLVVDGYKITFDMKTGKILQRERLSVGCSGNQE